MSTPPTQQREQAALKEFAERARTALGSNLLELATVAYLSG